MNNPATISIAIVFYLLLAIGAIIRIKRSRKLSASLQATGVFLPILPVIAMTQYGATSVLAILYGGLWLPMGLGYLLEGLEKQREAKAEGGA